LSAAEAHQPARLPASAAELDDWAVYGDALLMAGDPKGEWIARDLALPELVTPEQRAMLAECARATQQRGLSITWSLGHIKELALAKELSRGFGIRRVLPPAVQTMRFAIEQLRRPVGRLVESVSLSYARTVDAGAWSALMAALPATCTRVVLAIDLMSGGEPAEVLATLPPQVRAVSVGVVAGWLWPFIDDRFDEVDVTGLALSGTALSLRETRSVIVRVGVFSGQPPSPRIVFGGDGEAAIVTAARREAELIPRWDRFLVQEHVGILGARELMARTYPESYDLRVLDADTISVEPMAHGNCMRRGERWMYEPLPEGIELVTGDVDAYMREHFP